MSEKLLFSHLLTRSSFFSSVVSLLTLLAAACGSDNSSEVEKPPDAGAEDGGGSALPPRGSGSIYDDLDIEDPELDEFYFDDVDAPYDDVAGCKEFESAYPEVHSCGCEECYDAQRQCDALQGCREISDCGISIGCQDAFDCYLAPADSTCIPIIDKWGNTGVSSALALRLGQCTVTAGCREVEQ